MKTIVYMTINTNNQHFYVGVHLTSNPYGWDSYYGCGITGPNCEQFKHPKTPFQHAIKKYGFDAFKRITLAVFDTYEEALEMEKQIVTEDFIKRKDTYNAAVGGNGAVFDRQKTVYCYSLHGNLIQEFSSISNAARYFNVSHSSISYSIKSHGSCQKHYFSFDKVDRLDIQEYVQNKDRELYIYNELGEYIECLLVSEFKKKYGAVSDINTVLSNKHKIHNVYISAKYLEHFKIPVRTKNRNCKIYQYDEYGNFMREWDSQKEASEKLGLRHQTISNSIRNGKPCRNFRFSLDKVESMPPIKQRSKPILQYDLNGNFIKEWETIKSAKKEFPNVLRVLKGLCSQCKGFVFKYK